MFMKHLQIKILFFVYIFTFLCFESLYASTKALVTFKKGNSFVIRNNIKQEIMVNTLLEEKDIIKTEEDSYIHLQLSNGVMLRIGGNTQISIEKLLRDKENEEFSLGISEGEILTKVNKDKNKKIKLHIQSPTAVASVRGTEFYVESQNDSSIIAVNTGKVEVSSIDGTQKLTLEAGEKIIATFQSLKKSIMETYEKQKFQMIDQLEKTKKQNFENVIKQIEKNQKLLEEQRNKIQFPESPFKK